jgi:hypothetical protein
VNEAMTQVRATMSLIDEIMKPTKGKYRRPTMWSVTFIGDYVTMTTTVEANDNEDAIEEARLFLEEQYGYDVETFGATAERIG